MKSYVSPCFSLGDLIICFHRYLKSMRASPRRFNKWSAIPLPFDTNISHIDSWSLPHVIQRDCLRWERALRAEILMFHNKHWLAYSLECKCVCITKWNIKLFLSTKNISKEQKVKFNAIASPGTSVRLCEAINAPDKIMLGFVLSRTESFIEVQLQEEDNTDYSLFQGKSFLIQKWASKSNIGRLKFLMTRSADWEHLPGFGAMLYAYKCDMRIAKVPELDSCYSHSRHLLNNNNFDYSQQIAIEAVLDMNRPLVAVHGAPGTGKSRLLLECIDLLAQQGKRILLLCNISLVHLYRFLVKYYELTKRTDFILFNGFDEELLNSCIDDVYLRQIFQNKSVRMDISQTNVKEFCDRNDWRIACSSGSNSLLDAFVRNGISFDVFMADDAGRINEFDSWHHILTLSSRARLFGDSHNLQSAVQSIQAYKLQFGRSLLQRLSEQFGNEVNYYLSTQYRSNPRIREWPNRIFYKHESPINAKTVQNIFIEDYLIKEKIKENNLIREPLVLVDISLLNGEWNKQMFLTQKYGYSYFNWGHALIAAAHLSKLIENGFRPEMLSYITCNDAQRILTEHIISIILPSSLSENIDLLLIGKSVETLIGQQPEVIIKSRAFHLPLHYSLEPHRRDFNLALWNFEMSHAKRQFMAILQNKDLKFSLMSEFKELLYSFKRTKMLARNRFSINYFAVSFYSKYTKIFDSKRIILTQIQRIYWFSNKSLYFNNNGLFILPQLRNFSALHALAESFSSFLCNENFSLNKEWNERFKQLEKLQIGYDASDWIMLVQKKYSGGGKASAVDLDIASVMSEHNDHICDLIELCYKLRHTSNASSLFSSTEYAIFRLMLEHGDIENFMKVLNDPINYGLFPNEHCCCLYLNYFLNINDLQSAARLAVYIMHQEMFSQPFLNFLSVQALLQFIEQDSIVFPDFDERVFPSRAANIEEEMSFNEENVSIFRFPWLKTPHSDRHFDLQRTDELIGRSLELLSLNLTKYNNNIFISSIGFLGIILQGKYLQGLKIIEEIKNLVSSTNMPILLKTLQIAISFLKNKTITKSEKTDENEQQQTDETILLNLENDQKREELITLLENIYSSIANKEIINKPILLWQILQNEFLPIQESLESSLMDEQKKLFKEWENKRIKLIETQTERMEIDLRLDEIKKHQEEIKNEKDLLLFFENRHIWEDKALQRRILEEELDMFKKRGSLTEEEYGQTLFQMGQLLKEGKSASQALETLKLGTNPEEIKVTLTSRPEKRMK